MVYTPVCTFIYNAITLTPHSCLTVRIPSERSALPCVSFTLSCVSVCYRNMYTTRPCDLRRHAYCAARSPVNHWPVPATRRRRRGSNSPDKYTLPHTCYTAEFVRSRSYGTSVITEISLNKMTRRVLASRLSRSIKVIVTDTDRSYKVWLNRFLKTVVEAILFASIDLTAVF